MYLSQFNLPHSSTSKMSQYAQYSCSEPHRSSQPPILPPLSVRQKFPMQYRDCPCLCCKAFSFLSHVLFSTYVSTVSTMNRIGGGPFDIPARNRAVEPESLDIKAIVPMATLLSCSSFWATMMGPMVFV
ncbi:hypothetical protein TMatcc_008606 [Talaromyces marneffei ATCC 18224]